MNEKFAPSSGSLVAETISGADMIARVLVELRTEVVFAYSGGAVLPVLDAIFRLNEKSAHPISLVVPANEQGAGFMAAGYARATGKPGVVIVTSGPGVTNVVTPTRDCLADSIPLVVICGQVPTSAIGTDAFQEAPVITMMGGCAKHVFLVTDPNKLEPTMRSAFEIAITGRPGPVVIDIPKDIQNWCGAFHGYGVLPLPGYRSRLREIENRLDGDHCDEFLRLLYMSTRPLIYAGGGVVHGNASNALRDLSATFGVPVVTTLMGLGCYDTKAPLAAGMLGMYGAAHANYAVQDCDFLIAIGARFDDRVVGAPQKFAMSARIAHFDIDSAEINKIKKADWYHVGDLSHALRFVVSRAREVESHLGKQPDFAPWCAQIKKLKCEYAMNYDRESDLIQPCFVLEELNKLLRGECIVSTGVGLHQMWAALYLDFVKPRRWLTSGSMGTMGFGLPAAIGAAFANPNIPVIDIDGDGSLRMTIGELETVATYNLKVKVLLLNNKGDGMVRQWQHLFFGKRYSATDKSLRRKDFVKAAEADGFNWARRIERKEAVVDALRGFVSFDGPAFLEVLIDPDAAAYPLVPPGMGYDAMITGPYIRSRGAPAPIVLDAYSSQMF